MIFVLVVLGLVLVVVVVMLFRKGKTTPLPSPQKDLSSLSITEARTRDVVSIPAVGSDFEDLDFVVDRRNRYESSDDRWYELSGKYRERRVFVEFYEDDELEVTVNLGKRSLSLSDINLTKEELTRMDEEHSTTNGFEFEGQRWNYASSGEVGYFKDELGDGEGYYCWDFSSQDGRRELSIEKWEGKPFEGDIYEAVNPNDIKVFRS